MSLQKWSRGPFMLSYLVPWTIYAQTIYAVTDLTEAIESRAKH